MSPGLRLILPPLTTLGVFIGLAVLLSAWDLFAGVLRYRARLRGLRDAAKQAGWKCHREGVYDVVWSDGSGLIRTWCFLRSVDRWLIATRNPMRIFNNEADALEAALKEGP